MEERKRKKETLSCLPRNSIKFKISLNGEGQFVPISVKCEEPRADGGGKRQEAVAGGGGKGLEGDGRDRRREVMGVGKVV